MFKHGRKGLLYRIVDPHSGPRIKDGDFIVVDVIAKTDADSVLMNSRAQGSPTVNLMGMVQPGEVRDGLKYLTQGDSAVIKVNLDSVFGKVTKPVKGKYVIYSVRVEKVIPKAVPPDTTFNSRVTAYMSAIKDAQKQAEPARIKKYITDHRLSPAITPSGLCYVITNPGSGHNIAVGDTADILYTCRLVSGRLIETNILQVAKQNNINDNKMQYKPLHILIGQKHVIPGWEEGLQLLNKGAKAIFIVPSALAYREQGNALIPPYAPLVFEIEVVRVVKGNK